MNYKLKVLELKNNKKILAIDMEDKKYQKVAALLQSDVISDFEWYKDAMLSVLSEKKERICGTGNAYEINISLPYTRIYDAFTDDEFCEVKTEDLYNIIVNWEKDYKSFNIVE